MVIDFKDYKLRQDLARSEARAEQLFQIIKADNDPIEAAYDLWVTLAYHLVSLGFTPEQLSQDALFHAENAKRYGQEQDQ